MTLISWQVEKTRRVAFDAVFLGLAMMLSYLEFLLPLQLVLPLPGFKLGLANLAVVLVFVWISRVDALVISLLRIFLTSLLFGGITSFWFSLLGGLCAYLALFLSSLFLSSCSFWGVSLLSAFFHNLGQLLAASVLFGFEVFLSYLPFLCVASLIFGSLSGILLNLLSLRCGRILCKS